MASRPPGQPPISFKTVPNRNKTQKWQEAKTYNYDGDDWGGYDPYDEYGADEPPVPQAPSFQYAQQQGQRNVTTPAAAYGAAGAGYGGLGKGRTNSFDRGDDRRAFSGPGGFEQNTPTSPRGSLRRNSGEEMRGINPIGDPSQSRVRQREFSNPAHVPPPLNTSRPGTSTGGGGPAAMAAQTAAGFPPRKSSVGGGSGSQPTSATSDKELPQIPFIRPSDIYKRMEEEKERERASMDSSRPSMDSIQRSQLPAVGGLGARRSEDSQPSSISRQRSLEPVTEVRESYVEPDRSTRSPTGAREFNGFTVDNPQLAKALGANVASSPQDSTSLSPESARQGQQSASGPFLPPLRQISDFGSDFFNSTPAQTSSDATQASTGDLSVPTRAEPGTDPAAEILAERQSTRAQPGHDPANDILVERQASTASSLQRTPVMSQGPTFDNILGASNHPQPSQDQQPQQVEGGPQHQPSQGYRSVVSKAFDSGRRDDNSVPATPITCDNSRSIDSGVSRSNTNSTSGISPIMSRVPSAATTEQRQHQGVDSTVPPIAEVQEPPSASTSRPTSLSAAIPLRKPAPGHSRTVSGQSLASLGAGSSKSGVEQGYRRDLHAPGSDNSPARTPGLEDSSSRRLSEGLTATMGQAEQPDVPDQAAEVPEARLDEAEPPAGRPRLPSEVHGPEAVGVQVGRGRSGTNYSIREADLARELSSSPEKDGEIMGGGTAALVEAERHSREAFLATHRATPTETPTTPGFPSPFAGPMRSETGMSPESDRESGRVTPGKGRVKEIKNRYDELHETIRRGSNASVGSSKSSWSRFTGSPQRERSPERGDDMHSRTGSIDPTVFGGGIAGAQAPGLGVDRPDVRREQSFRPDMPGGWVSNAPTPGPEEQSPSLHPIEDTRDLDTTTPRQSRQMQVADEEIDLTPTTKRVPLRGSGGVDTFDAPSHSFLDQARGAGEALGASLISSVGVGHKTRDFANPEPEEPGPAVQQPETAAKPFVGENNWLSRPQLDRWESDASGATAMSAVSVASEVPPGGATSDLKTPVVNQSDGNRLSGYFAGVDGPSPLRPSRSREEREAREAGLTAPRPQFAPTLSTDTAVQDTESDRLRKDIVRSLENVRDQHNADSTRDVVDAPDNQRRFDQGLPPPPGAETQHARDLLPSQRNREHANALAPPPAVASLEAQRDHVVSPTAVSQPLPGSATQAASRPGIMDQRYSWENRLDTGGPAIAEGLWSPEQAVNESMLNLPKRPPSRLHVVNAEVDDDSPLDSRKESVGVSPITKSQENLANNSSLAAPSEIATTPTLNSDELTPGRDIPSYYAGAGDDNGLQAVDPEPVNDSDKPLPAPVEQLSTKSPTTDKNSTSSPIEPTTPASRIPPFRELMAIKSPQERIRRYEDTRETFAGMDTGLAGWLSQTLASRPEFSGLSVEQAKYKPSAGLASIGTLGRGHRSGPSIGKFTKQFSSTEATIPGGTRKPSATGNASVPMGGAGSGEAGQGGIDVEKMQAKGKDLMKSAGVFGGKAQAGAKGLLAKGKSRFGSKGDKASSSSYASPKSSSKAIAGPTIIKKPSDAAIPSAKAAKNEPASKPQRSDHPTNVAAIDSAMSTPQLGDSVLMAASKAEVSRAPPQYEASSLAERPQAEQENVGSTPQLNDTPRTHTPAVSESDNAAAATAEPRRPPSRSLSATFSRLRERSSRSSKGSWSSRPSSFILGSSGSRPVSSIFGWPASDKSEKTSAAASRSRSRPASLVLTNADIFEMSDGEAETSNIAAEALEGGKEQTITRTAPGTEGWGEPVHADSAIVESPTTPKQTSHFATSARKETWEDPAVQLPQTPRRDDGFSGRLGVLPSPNKVDPMTPPATSSASHSRSVSAASLGEDGSPEFTTPPQHPKPGHRRQNSDLSDLPSQKRLSLILDSPSSPRSPTFSQRLSVNPPPVERSESDELYTVTPTAARNPWTTSAEQTGEQLPQPDPIVASPSRYRIVNSTPSPSEERSPIEEQLPQPQVTELGREAALTTAGDEPQADAGADAIKTTQKKTSLDSLARRSEISAEDNFGDVKDIVADHRPSSRHSSVSSLGDPQSPDTIINRQSHYDIAENGSAHTPLSGVNRRIEEQQMADQAVSAGPVSPILGSRQPDMPTRQPALRQIMQPPTQLQKRNNEQTREQQGIMMRQAHPNRPQRPLSYMAMPRDVNGTPQQETLGGPPADPVEVVPMDLTLVSGPPPGAPPFLQHPLLRNQVAPGSRPSQPIAYDNVRRSSQAGDIPASTADPGEKRFSGFFRGAETPASTLPGVVPLDGDFGEHSRQASSTSISRLAGGNARQQSSDGENKRRSGIWNAFKRTPSLSNTDTSDAELSGTPPRASTATTPASKVPTKEAEGLSRRNVLQKPQRAVSSAAAPTEPKKSRFSLSRMFGRSSTQGHNTPKPNKLTKAHSPTSETQQRRGYADYEAALRQQRLADWKDEQRQPMRASMDGRPPSTAQSRPRARGSESMNSVPAPPEGWYAPDNDEYEQDHSSYERGPGPPPFRRLHSGGRPAEGRFQSVPEAFRPVEASYNQPIQPIGPPPDPRASKHFEPAASPTDPTIPIEHRAWPTHTRPMQPPVQLSAGSPVHSRQSSYGSNEYALAPQLSGRSEYEQPYRPRQSSSPAIAPSVQRAYSDGPMSGRAFRVGSIDRAMAQNMQNSRTPSWAAQASPQPYFPPVIEETADEQPGLAGRHPPQGQERQPPRADYYDYYGPPLPHLQQQQQQQRTPSGGSGMQYSPSPPPPQFRQQGRPLSGGPRMQYSPSPPPPSQYYTGSPPGPSPGPYRQPPPDMRGPYDSYRYPRQRGPPQDRYYGPLSQGGGPYPPLQHPNGPAYGWNEGNGQALTYQRTPSGFSGRRDDMTVSEQELGMKGVSYPGQEWDPSRT